MRGQDAAAMSGRWIAALAARPTAAVGGAIILVWAATGLLAPWIAPHDPAVIDFMAAADPRPSAVYPLGTDMLGRDLLSRIIWGARTTFTVVPLAVGSAFLLGTSLGLVAGYRGGWVDALISRASDLMLAFPALILYIVLITTIGPSLLNIVIAVTLAYAPGVARLARGQALAIRTLDFVRAAEARREPAIYILLVEILPNARTTLIVDLCLRAGYTVIFVGTLGFLGLGLPPPTPDWGGMVVENAPALSTQWQMVLFPCMAITSLVIGFNLLADGLRRGAPGA